MIKVDADIDFDPDFCERLIGTVRRRDGRRRAECAVLTGGRRAT